MPRTDLLDASDSIERVRALREAGYTCGLIGEAGRISAKSVWELGRAVPQRWITPRNAAGVQLAFVTLMNHTPPHRRRLDARRRFIRPVKRLVPTCDPTQAAKALYGALTGAEPCANRHEAWFRAGEVEQSEIAEWCLDCPVMTACGDYALTHPNETEYGVWGGMTEGQRDELLARA